MALGALSAVHRSKDNSNNRFPPAIVMNCALRGILSRPQNVSDVVFDYLLGRFSSFSFKKREYRVLFVSSQVPVFRMIWGVVVVIVIPSSGQPLVYSRGGFIKEKRSKSKSRNVSQRIAVVISIDFQKVNFD